MISRLSEAVSHMSKFLKLALFVVLVSFVASEISGICKWVDENGVVHYAATCPEGVGSTDVQIHEAPSKEQVEATTRRSEKMREEKRVRSERSKQEEEQQAQERQAREAERGVVTDKCAEARWNLNVLRKQLPVYFDEEHLLHSSRSLHDEWYAGKRTYLDDPQRQAEIAHYIRVEADTCTESEAEIRARCLKYQEIRNKTYCGYLKSRLELMRKRKTGIPSDAMRDLEQVINTKCD